MLGNTKGSQMSKKFQIGLLMVAFLSVVLTSYAVWKKKKDEQAATPAEEVIVKPAEAPATEAK